MQHVCGYTFLERKPYEKMILRFSEMSTWLDLGRKVFSFIPSRMTSERLRRRDDLQTVNCYEHDASAACSCTELPMSNSGNVRVASEA